MYDIFEYFYLWMLKVDYVTYMVIQYFKHFP